MNALGRSVKRPVDVLAWSAALVFGAAVLAGCGDPLVVVGDLPGTMRIVAGVPDTSGVSLDSVATESPLSAPTGLATHQGTLYIADPPLGRILEVTPDGRIRLVTDRTRCPMPECLSIMESIVTRGDSVLVVTDSRANRLWSVDREGGDISLLAGNGERGNSPDGSMASAAALNQPTGVAVGPDGRVYFAERWHHRVRTIDPDGTLRTIAGTGEAGSDGDDGPATLAQLDQPAGLALSGGVLFVVDAGNQRIRSIELASGIIGTVAGTGTAGFGGDGGPATEAALRDPEAIAVGQDGRALFIADTGNHRIRRVDLLHGTIDTFAGNGTQDFSGRMRNAGDTALDAPRGVATSDFGFLFISDTGHNIVWRTSTER